jgi:phosphoribosylaminoimidazole-succinocarboxamide synthase
VNTGDQQTPLRLVHSGKVRDVYEYGTDELLLVASDRVSVYDVVLPTPIPEKGAILTQLSLWWFEQLADLVPNHVISTDVPSQFAGRAIRVRKLRMIQVECIARGYLAGLGLAQYRASGTVSGVPLPAGLREADKLGEPIFTPTTKLAGASGHDEPMTYAEVAAQEGEDVAAELRRITLAVYGRGAEVAAKNGIIVADTKLEFGWAPDGALTLGDEVLTSDSSRFWRAAGWEPGRTQHALDKQFVRDWAAGTGWDKRPPAPEVPDDVVAATRDRYIEVYEKLTGRTWSPGGGSWETRR